MHVSFNRTPEEELLIRQIVDRAERLAYIETLNTDRTALAMDITATHANGNPLRLWEFLNADEFNFAHDLFGIVKHLDRETGKLMNHFRPRFSQPASETEGAE